MKRLGVTFFTLLFSLLLRAENEKCKETLSHLATQDMSSLVEGLAQAEKKITLENNPFIEAGLDGHAIGRIQDKLRRISPSYDRMYELIQKDKLNKKELEDLKRILSETTQLSKKTKLTPEEKLLIKEISHLADAVSLKFPSETPEKKHFEEDEQKKDPDKDSPEEGPPPDPWQKPPKEYEPHNKRVEQGKGGSQELLRTDASSIQGFYPQIYYDQFSAVKLRSDPSIRELDRPSQDATTHKNLRVKFYDSTEATLCLPDGYVPIGADQGAKLLRDENGAYVLRGSKPNTTVDVKIAPKEGLQKPPQLHNYLNPSGLALQKWPEDIQQFIQLTQAGGGSPIQKAKAIQEFIRNRYKYYSEGEESSKEDLDKADQIAAQFGSEPKIIQMAHSKMLNCDGDSLTAGIWLRDYLNIPTRLVGGRTLTGTQTEKGTEWEVVTTSSANHMWLEIWEGQKWVPFDMQPPHTPHSKESDQSQRLANKKKEQKSSNGKKDKNQKNESSQGEQDQEKDKKDAEKSKEQHGQEKDKESEQTKEKSELVDAKPGQESANVEALSKQANPVFYLLLNAFKAHSLEASLDRGYGMALQDTLNSVKRLDGTDLTIETLRKSVEQYTDELISKFPHGESLNNRLGQTKLEISQNKMTEAYQHATQMASELGELAKIRPLSKDENQLRDKLYRVIEAFNSEGGEAATIRGQLRQVLDALPGAISRKMFLEEIGAERGITPMVLKNFSQFWASPDKRRYYEQLIAASPFAEVLLKGHQEPVYRRVPTDNKSPVPTNRQDVMRATRISEISKFIWDPKPGQDLLQPFVEGEQLALSHRETVKMVSPRLPLERKHTEILVDVSGSMSGDKAQAMTALLGAFIDKTLTERDAMGLPLSTLGITHFSDRVDKQGRIAILDPEEALKNLRILKHSTLDTPGGSTAVRDAVYEGIEEIHNMLKDPKSNAKLKRTLSRANVLVFTDGDDNASKHSIANIQGKISSLPSKINLNLGVIGLEMAGNALKEFETLAPPADSKPAKNQKPQSSIKSLSAGDVGGIVSPKAVELSETETAKNFEGMEATEKLKEAIRELLSPQKFLVSIDHSTLNSKKLPNTTNENYQNMSSQEAQAARTLVVIANELTKQREIPTELRVRIAASFLENYSKLTGRTENQLLKAEVQALSRLKDWALGRTGTGP